MRSFRLRRLKYSFSSNLKHPSILPSFPWKQTYLTTKAAELTLPQVFTKLTQLQLSHFPCHSVWYMIEFCGNITRLRFTKTYGHLDVQDCKRLVAFFNQNRCQNLEFLDMEKIDIYKFELEVRDYQQLISDLCSLMTKCNMKLLNVSSWIFDELEETQVNQIAPRIVTLGKFEMANHELRQIHRFESFPNVRVSHLSFNLSYELYADEPLNIIIARNMPVLSRERMPHLRKLIVSFNGSSVWDSGSRLLVDTWHNFVNIEELYFQLAWNLGDLTFIGENGELPFLQLISGKTCVFSIHSQCWP